MRCHPMAHQATDKHQSGEEAYKRTGELKNGWELNPEPRFSIEWLFRTPALWHYTVDLYRCIKLGASFAIPRLLK